MTLLSLLTCVATLVACPSPASQAARSIHVTVRDEQGQALVGVPIELDGLSATRTGHDGSARISLSPVGGARARVGVSCAADQRAVAPRHVLRSAAGATAKLELSFVCRPVHRKLAVVVRAPGGQGLWLRADGEPVGRIEPDGTLHANLSRPPDSELRLTLDTGDLPLTPRHPMRVVQVGDRDELVVFDQGFVRRPARRALSAQARASPFPLHARAEQRAASEPHGQADKSCDYCEERNPECDALDDWR